MIINTFCLYYTLEPKRENEQFVVHELWFIDIHIDSYMYNESNRLTIYTSETLKCRNHKIERYLRIIIECNHNECIHQGGYIRLGIHFITLQVHDS